MTQPCISWVRSITAGRKKDSFSCIALGATTNQATNRSWVSTNHMVRSDKGCIVADHFPSISDFLLSHKLTTKHLRSPMQQMSLFSNLLQSWQAVFSKSSFQPCWHYCAREPQHKQYVAYASSSGTILCNAYAAASEFLSTKEKMHTMSSSETEGKFYSWRKQIIPVNQYTNNTI